MSQEYEYSQTIAQDLNDLIRDLLCRRRFHDLDQFSYLVIDQIFNSTFDLLRIPSNQIDFAAFNQLIGFESDVFKQICQDPRLFEHFVVSTINHSRRRRWALITVRHSAFVAIFQIFLDRFLPLNEDNLAYLKGCDWFTTVNKRYAKTSALRLLRPEVVAAAFEPEFMLHSGGGVRSMYPKIYDFSKLIFDGLANCSVIPLPAQVYVLNRFIIHYTSFLFTTLSDPDFEKFKQMMRDSGLLEKQMKLFLSRWLQTLAFDDMYAELLEIWLYLIFPADTIIAANNDKMLVYYKLYSKCFIELIHIIENRCRVADLSIISHVKFISTIVDGVYDSTFCVMFRKLKIEPEDFLDELRDKVFLYLAILEEQRQEKESKKLSMAASLFGYFKGYVTGPTSLEKELRYIVEALNRKIMGKTVTPLNASSISSNTSTGSFNPLANSTPKNTPDHSVDPKTKLFYLTPRGRQQVLQRKAVFDFSKCINKSNRSIIATPYEIPFLVPLFTHLSQRYSNSNFVNWMRVHRHDSKMAALMSKMFLVPSAPKFVPVYSKVTVSKLPQLNLRFMASYPFVIFAVFIMFLTLRVISYLF